MSSCLFVLECLCMAVSTILPLCVSPGLCALGVSACTVTVMCMGLMN